MVYRFSEANGKEPDYKIGVRLFGRELISLNVDTATELNGSKPLLFFSFMLATALVAGGMFGSVLAFIWVLDQDILIHLFQ